MYPIPTNDFGKVQALFEPLSAFQPFCASVLAGIFPGAVFADHPEQPHSACTVTRQNWVYLAGNPHHQAFNRALNRAFFQREIINENVGALLFTCHPVDWGGHLEDIFAPRTPIAMPRRHYTSHQLKFDWRTTLPDGFEVRSLKLDLLAQTGLEIPYPLQETLENWKDIVHPQFSDYGFIAIQKDTGSKATIAAWATVDGVCAGSGDLGFETQPEFRRRGLGTTLAGAAIEHGLQMGLKTIHWTCAETNIASHRTAEKLGLQHQSDYTLYLLIFDEAHELAQKAYLALESGNYQATMAMYDRFFSLSENPPAWAHIDCARACAALGNTDQALHHLTQAVNLGWKDLPDTLSYQEFRPLYDLPAWQKIMEEMQKERL